MTKYITAGNCIRFMGVLFGCVAFMCFVVMCLALFYDPAAAPLICICFCIMWTVAIMAFRLANSYDMAEAERQWWEARNNG